MAPFRLYYLTCAYVCTVLGGRRCGTRAARVQSHWRPHRLARAQSEAEVPEECHQQPR
jgi:hypothetical protein